jgi:hypothetical protein
VTAQVGFPDSSQRQFRHPSRRVTSRRTVTFPLKPLLAATFGDDVPVVRAGSPLLQLLAESEQIKAGKQTDERHGIAIAMRVAFSLDLVDDESVGSDRAANAVIRIAGREHRRLQQPGRQGWPSSANWAIGLLVGINMIFLGFSLVMTALAARMIATP